MPLNSPVSTEKHSEPSPTESTEEGRASAENGPLAQPPRTANGLAARAAHGASAASKAASADRTGVPPIIVATADPSLGRMLSFALNQMRLQYRLLDSGSLTLRELLDLQVGSQRPLVVLDVDLPGVDGHAILERIGVDRPDTFLILVLSSHADESVQVRSLLAGALDHLAKPFNVRVLMAKIQRWVAISAHLSGAA